MACLSPRYQAKAASEDRAPILLWRPKRSRCARGVILTRYAMRRFKFRKELFDVAAFPLLGFLQALADSLEDVRAGGNVEQPLVGLGVLHNGRGFTLNRQDDGALALLELFHKVAGAAAEGGQRMDVSGDVEHEIPSYL